LYQDFNSCFSYKPKMMEDTIRVMIVDDDADDRELFTQAVKEVNEHIECITAKDGKQALELLRQSEFPLPDLIFLDQRMPRISGKKCLEEIKKDTRLENIPVIIYTTSKNETDSEELHSMGAVHFISKPSNPEEIYYVVSLVLEEQLLNLRKGK
jgi:CheY-like chemotaxis protein